MKHITELLRGRGHACRLAHWHRRTAPLVTWPIARQFLCRRIEQRLLRNSRQIGRLLKLDIHANENPTLAGLWRPRESATNPFNSSRKSAFSPSNSSSG